MPNDRNLNKSIIFAFSCDFFNVLNQNEYKFWSYEKVVILLRLFDGIRFRYSFFPRTSHKMKKLRPKEKRQI
jgi:hypothetical protein